MWIRSQDKKELIDITGKRVYVWIYKGWKIYIDPMTSDEDNTICMGEYGDDQDKAIKVLDMINNCLMEYEYAKGGSDACNYVVFKMPQSEEVK